MKIFFATLFVLVEFSGFAGVPYVVNLGGKSTNLTSFNATNRYPFSIGTNTDYGMMTMTNASDFPANLGVRWDYSMGTNSFDWQFHHSFGLSIFDFFINRTHGGASSDPANTEIQISTFGAMALGLGYQNGNVGHLQFGIGGSSLANQYGGNVFSFQDSSYTGGYSNGHSGFITWRASVGNGLGTPGSIWTFYPGIVGQVTATNSTPKNSQYELTFFPTVDYTAGNTITDSQIDVRAYNTNGLRLIWSGIAGDGPTNAALFDMNIIGTRTASVGGIVTAGGFAGTTNATHRWFNITLPCCTNGTSFYTNTFGYDIVFSVKGTGLLVVPTTVSTFPASDTVVIAATTQVLAVPMNPQDVLMITNTAITGANGKIFP